MKVMVMDESSSRTEQLSDALKQMNNDVVSCFASGDFMEKIEEFAPDLLLLDVDTWQRGKSIYNYFNFPAKIEELPIVFYNAPENFSAITGRNKNEKDVIVARPFEVDEVIEVVGQI